ncbi:NADH:ubiquinone reductase (Na(+)-transporting) subunit F [bacterium]|nr:NADH:ubiquinone reductase (Na(+)-transporting) subunit F [bacterium]
MSHSTTEAKPKASTEFPDPAIYSLNRNNSRKAIEAGLAEADWYQCPVPREVMRKLLVRRDGPAIRDTLIWFGILFGAAAATVALWGSWWAVLPYLVYAAIYGGSADSRWHESSHGTAFKTDWMNSALYEVASFMVLRESVIWRWSHTRHHSDTIIVGRDPEIAVPRPPDIKSIILAAFAITAYPAYFKSMFLHASGRISERDREFVPESEHRRVFWTARVHLFIYLSVIAAAILSQSWLPVLFIGLPNLFGTWLMVLYGLTQHTGLAEDVLDHRLNSRTFFTNRLNRFLYWNMNYHIEHHMFPLVPYHAVPVLYEAIKGDCPPAYPSLLSCWKEMIPTLLRQCQEPGYHVRRALPEPVSVAHCKTSSAVTNEPEVGADGWIEICASADLGKMDALRFDHGGRSYAFYRDAEGKIYATDGICTHGNTHLADGLVVGKMIECPKHNGRFNLDDGSPARAPICRGLQTYEIEERDKRIHLRIPRADEAADKVETMDFTVVSNENVATFIKELVLRPAAGQELPDVTPGDYLQIDIPEFERIRFSDFHISDPFREVWEGHGLFDLDVSHTEKGRRNNYSIANIPSVDGEIRFNVRIATPPRGQDCPPGVGSSYVFNLKPGDTVSTVGPFGDFHIKPTQREMVYLGGGAGMAPMRAHLAHLLEVDDSPRQLHFWYGARSKQEIFYADYFEGLAEQHENFDFNLVLSEPLESEQWDGLTGFVHEIARQQLLEKHPDLSRLEFYLCGPPPMVEAVNEMLTELKIAPDRIACDAF